MAKTHKGVKKEIRFKSARLDHETKSDLKNKVLTGYYFEREMDDIR